MRVVTRANRYRGIIKMRGCYLVRVAAIAERHELRAIKPATDSLLSVRLIRPGEKSSDRQRHFASR